MNHLEEAKDQARQASKSRGASFESRIAEANVHALISIAESLEKMNDMKLLGGDEFRKKYPYEEEQ